MDRTYIAIDLKSFYASVECIQRGLDPMTTNLVVADSSRTEKTICLAVSPSLKSFGISGRARLFEVVQQVAAVNALRRDKAPNRTFTGASCQMPKLLKHPELAVDYHIAPPQMALYMERSTRIYNIYLKYIAPEDIHVYSIDEVFMDVTHYLKTYGKTARELAMTIILDVLESTGITATAGIGPNLFLCKVAMDVEAKHIPPDENGVRIAELTELSFRQKLWGHRPLTDFWRIGRGTAKKLEQHGLFTLGDIARCSMQNEDLLYKLFGIQAELLIDHAWGYESCTMAHIKAYRPTTNSLSSGQVLHCPYDNRKAKLIVREMADALSLDLVDKALATDQITLTIGYDTENVKLGSYRGEVVRDVYGRDIPRHGHGTANLGSHTASTRQIVEAVSELYDRITDPNLLVRRITLCANHVLPENRLPENFQQLDLFTDPAEQKKQQQTLAREKRRQKAVVTIQKRFGKNAIFKGMSLEEGATAMDRNRQIGGHKA